SLAAAYSREAEAGLVMRDISASRESRGWLMDTVHRVAERLVIPLTVGGGVRSLVDARRLLAAGADKVAVNTAAVESPELVRELAAHYGCQAIVVAVDARRIDNLKWEVATYGGTRQTGLDAVEWAGRAESPGAGEMLRTQID